MPDATALVDQDAILLPHRYELRASLSSAQRLLIDGPIDASAIESWHHPASNAVMASYCNGPMISFDRPQNPHSGFFGLTRQQLHHLRDKSLPVSGFVGPLETAATYTAGKYFHLYKPSLKHSLFLLIENVWKPFEEKHVFSCEFHWVPNVFFTENL